MVEPNQILTFSTAALVVLLVPGPAVAFVVARSLEHGPRGGLISQLGLCAGLSVHVITSALGVSAIVARSAVAFELLRTVGVIYLIYLGVRSLQHAESDDEPRNQLKGQSGWRNFVDGVVIDLFNPKPALFFLAFLPQFVEPSKATAYEQSLWLGLIFIMLALITGGLYAIAAGLLADRIGRSPRSRSRIRWANGLVYLSLGVLAAAWKN